MTWALLLLVATTPALLLCAAWALIPSPDDPPRWQLALARGLERVADRLRREPPRTCDPFATLRVQERLGVVAAHVRELEGDVHAFARAERIISSQLAYDQLLAEACRLAEVEVRPAAKGDPHERFREEVELTARGWSW
ncbi:hypothetical protein [Cellulomonas oligotrophica]|uniref:Uncharacterized protein n=1 Tax=Cellulomonas oligotrophica TaxID=931536 RepID=A0A7Y9JZY9_9CELL|nr:hypothetical protein [Cellulomonas oligotrophica]NYD86765.1 hypothetical protein [Cellulomonas oligotrophica]GIG32449.1 hypothetical protein Col01nite_16080 [Cellulomonas oligotrophica]